MNNPMPPKRRFSKSARPCPRDPAPGAPPRLQRVLVLLFCLLSAGASAAMIAPSGLSVREIQYDARLSTNEARFTVNIDAEATAKGESSAKLFEGEVALLPPELPSQLKIVRDGNAYFLVASHPGRFRLTLDLVARIHQAEPWNQVSFTGPAATIASVTAHARGHGMAVQLLSGTLLESMSTNGVTTAKGFLGADQTVALRWQGKVTQVARKTLLTVDSTIAVQVAPTVIKYTSRFHYEIVQGQTARLTLALPAGQVLTRLVGEQIRDWHTTNEGNRQVLMVEFIKPVEKSCNLTLYSEQTIAGLPAAASLNPPEPLEVDRESGSLNLVAEDTLVEIASLSGLRQVNAPNNALAAYQFYGRPFTLALRLNRIEPVINVADRVSARLEEMRLVVIHRLNLDVEKAGIYSLAMSPQPGFAVAEVRGDGIEDWQVGAGSSADSKVLRVNFAARVLGTRQLVVQLEQPLKAFPDHVIVEPLRVADVAKETAQIGAGSVAGIQLRSAGLSDLREIPVRALQTVTNDMPGQSAVGQLAYSADQPDWKLTLASERLAPRVVADVFNLITVGDGIVGGSATIRYGIVNQGVQQFQVRLPAWCKNVEFTGLNIRRKELVAGSVDTNFVVWTIGLQDKIWGGYTLVVTYDYPFDSARRDLTLPVGGVHARGVERETGSIAVTTAANLRLSAQTASSELRRVDEAGLSPGDRALITRAVVLAYQYTGDHYELALDVKRYAEAPVLEAVADRTQITSVLTEAGEMLTQASFMVKNNEKQFQRFLLPKGASLWSCYVNDQPAKPERDGGWVLVPLPRGANRDQAFSVDIVYAEKKGAPGAHWSEALNLAGPRTDVPNTYAEWQLFVPPAFRLSHFGGSMTVAEGTTYQLFDAWQKFLRFYLQVLHEAGSTILVIGLLAFLVIALVISAARRGWNGIITVLAVLAILAVLGAMMLPALAKAKAKAQRISSVNNLKQIGLAVRIFAGDNHNRLPTSYEEMMNELNTDKITYDPETGTRYVYLGGGLQLDNLKPDSVLAYSPIANGHCNVLMADGRVQMMTAAQFGELSQRGLVQVATPAEIARRRQTEAVMQGQLMDRLAPATQRTVTPIGYAGAATVAGEPAAGVPATPPPVEAPTVAGLRSIRIELPQTGRSFLFTKVLNLGDEPLSIRARIMSLRTFQAMQMAWQVAAFLLGLVVCWWQWRRARSSSFVLTMALVLIFGSVGSLLIQWRALHDALIVGFPLVTLAVLSFLIWKYWPRGRQVEPAPTTTPASPQPGPSLPPAVAVITLGFVLAIHSASAAPAKSNDQSSVSDASIVSADYSGTVNDRVGQIEAVLHFSSGQSGQTIPLFGADVAVQECKVLKGRAELVREGGNIAVRLERRGDVAISVSLLVKVTGDVTKQRLAFGIPPALSSRVALTLDQPDVDVDFPTAISFQRVLARDETRVEAIMGAADHVELLWTPRVKRAAEVAATVFCHNASLVTFAGGMVDVRSTLDYQVAQGELCEARVRLPARQRLLRVEGAEIRTWEIESENGGANSRILVVHLIKGVSPSWRLTVQTESPLEALPANVSIAVPHALNVQRETGLVGLQSAEELGLSVESASGLQRVDAEEFTRLERGREGAVLDTQTGADKTGGLFSVFRFSRPEFALRVGVEAIQPQIEAVVHDTVRVSRDEAALSAVIDYTIKRSGVFALKLALPVGYRVERVSGSNILQQAEHTESGQRVLELTLKERTSGAYTVSVELSRNFSELPRSLPIEGVYPLGTAKLTGFVAVSAGPGVALKTGQFDGLTEIPSTDLPGRSGVETGGVLAYKSISAEPTSAPQWKLTVAAESVAAWVRAEVVDTFTLSETLIRGRALVRYDIANAPVKELRVRIPAGAGNVEIAGPNIRSRDRTGDVWRVELQSETRGVYTLTVTWEQTRTSPTNSVALAGVSAMGVERETGLIAIVAKTPLRVSELEAGDLQRVDTGDFPDWAVPPGNTTVLAYRYVRPGYTLTLDLRRYEEARVLQALVDRARLTTVVTDDGQMMTEMSLSVRNNGRQFLEVELPAGATVWSAFVAGQPVQPSLSQGKILLPIQPYGSDDGALAVELTYAGTNSFPRTRGPVTFDSPRFDVPVKNASWEVYLPPHYSYDDFQGTMTRELIAAEPFSTSFSQLDYTRMERASKASAKAEVLKDVSEAEQKLAGGSVREAMTSFGRAKANANYYNGDEAGVKDLERKLNSAQASNLIVAQSDFTLRNAGKRAEANAPRQSEQLGLQYDDKTAERQWIKLQQAQELATARVEPLHVNLPLRGLRLAFSQVLQTEIGKPMTVEMFASSTKAVSWPKRAGKALAGFLALWAMVEFLLRVGRRPINEENAAA